MSGKGKVIGLKVPTLLVGYLKNGIFWCNKTFASKEQMMAAPGVNQDYHNHFESIEVFLKSFTSQKFNRKRHHQCSPKWKILMNIIRKQSALHLYSL
jgi:hypothetical protein